MNLQELIDEIEPKDPELAAKLRSLAPPDQTDLTKLKIVERFCLKKFEGEYEPEKEPYEIIEGGDDIPTVIHRNL